MTRRWENTRRRFSGSLVHLGHDLGGLKSILSSLWCKKNETLGKTKKCISFNLSLMVIELICSQFSVHLSMRTFTNQHLLSFFFCGGVRAPSWAKQKWLHVGKTSCKISYTFNEDVMGAQMEHVRLLMAPEQLQMHSLDLFFLTLLTEIFVSVKESD